MSSRPSLAVFPFPFIDSGSFCCLRNFLCFFLLCLSRTIDDDSRSSAHKVFIFLYVFSQVGPPPHCSFQRANAAVFGAFSSEACGPYLELKCNWTHSSIEQLCCTLIMILPGMPCARCSIEEATVSKGCERFCPTGKPAGMKM